MIINLERQISVLQALADETRIRIIMLLTHGEFRVDDLVQTLALPQSKISRHLAYLKNAGLIRDRRQWNQVFYAVNMHDQAIAGTIMPFLRSFFARESTIRKDVSSLKKIPVFRKKDGAQDKRTRVLFICEHNSARSQMAEAYLNHLHGNAFKAESAGLMPTTIHPLVIAIMKEESIDISKQRSKSISSLIENSRTFDIVITVCDESKLHECPVFPGERTRIHWDIADPAAATGSPEEQLETIREIWNRIKTLITQFSQTASI